MNQQVHPRATVRTASGSVAARQGPFLATDEYSSLFERHPQTQRQCHIKEGFG